MADVFLSYRNTPERRALVRRLANILHVHGVEAWWDYGLEAGESYRDQIMRELGQARIVAPLWCSESVQSKWVAMEAEFGKAKLVPARLQKVAPPAEFEAIQAADLIGWDGAVNSPQLSAFVRKVCERLGRFLAVPAYLMEELAHLPPIAPLPETAIATTIALTPKTAAPELAWSKEQWAELHTSKDIARLERFIAHAHPFYAAEAEARVSDLKAVGELAQRYKDDWKRVAATDSADNYRSFLASPAPPRRTDQARKIVLRWPWNGEE